MLFSIVSFIFSRSCSRPLLEGNIKRRGRLKTNRIADGSHIISGGVNQLNGTLNTEIGNQGLETLLGFSLQVAVKGAARHADTSTKIVYGDFFCPVFAKVR